MLRFAANLSFLYPEHAFLDRFAAAAADGFAGVEYLFPYPYAAADLAARLRDHALAQALFNAPAGDWAAGERGLACLPGRQAAFRAGFEQALAYAQALDCPRIHVMAGCCPPEAPPQQLRDTFLSNLDWAARQAAAHGRQVLIEPLNTHDVPGYFLTRQQQAHEIVQAVGAPNLRVQLDLYHCQIMEGEVAATIGRDLPTGRVGHVQIAGVPGRHEPDAGALNGPQALAELARAAAACGWSGWVGCEYHPRLGAAPGGTRAGLGWLRQCQAAQAGGA